MLPFRPAVATAVILGAVTMGCEATAVETGTVELTLRLELVGGPDVGATPARVYVFTDSQPLSRGAVYPEVGEACVLSTTPVTTCTMTVPGNSTVSLVVTEPDPAVFVRFAPSAAQDTVRDGRYVEFTGWTGCTDATERGVCVVRPSNDVSIVGEFQLMQQVTVSQTGAARMDYVTIAAAPTLKLPAQAYNILDLAGCRRVLTMGAPCDSVRLVGDVPHHRFTAYVPRATIVGMFPRGGAQTDFVRWDGPCIPSTTYHLGVCSLISPDTSGPPILLTVRYQWWSCPGGPNDRNTGGCFLTEPPALGLRTPGRR